MKPGVHSVFAVTISVFASLTPIALAQVPPQIVPAPASGDIFVGVRASGGTGANDSYLVNLGPDTNFTTAAEGASFLITTGGLGRAIGNLSGDLVAKYGSDWHSRTDLHWGIFGSKNPTNPVLFGSRARPSVPTASIPWNALPPEDRDGTDSAIRSVLEGLNGYRGRLSTANSLVATFQENVPGGSSKYSTQVATPGNTDFSTFSGWSDIEANPTSSLDLYRISGSLSAPVTRVGYFTISAAGTITFTKPSSGPNPLSDDDGDGVTNGQEAIAGTNPNNPADFFKVSAFSRAVGTSGLSFTPIAARTYVLEYSENLQPPWETVTQYVAGSTPPSLHQLVDNDTVRLGRAKGFYRIRVSQTTP